jgi:hypothetical protein
VGECVGCAYAAHDSRYYVHMCAMRVHMSTLGSVSGVRLQGGVHFYDEVVGVFKVIVRAIFSFSYLNFTSRGVPARQ